MRYAQLKAFHAVAVNGGFSKAAERLALTQPAISDHIRKLEDAYGSELFLRRRGGVELTPFARKLFALTERIFEAETEALELLSRAKGLEERVVVLRHALRNALIPVVTLGALEFGALLSGAVLTEQVFSIPGFGKLIVDAVFNRDYAVVQGVVLCTATAYIVLNLLADITYFLINPRLRA